MSKVTQFTQGISKSVKAMGLFTIMATLVAASFMAAPAAQAGSLQASTLSRSAPEGKLTIYALDSVSGDTVQGAEIQVLNSAGREVAKGVTSANGEYSGQFARGQYKIIVQARGYKQTGESITVVANTTTSTKIALTPAK